MTEYDLQGLPEMPILLVLHDHYIEQFLSVPACEIWASQPKCKERVMMVHAFLQREGNGSDEGVSNGRRPSCADL